jgi:hypothetical protein
MSADSNVTTDASTALSSARARRLDELDASTSRATSRGLRARDASTRRDARGVASEV